MTTLRAVRRYGWMAVAIAVPLRVANDFLFSGSAPDLTVEIMGLALIGVILMRVNTLLLSSIAATAVLAQPAFAQSAPADDEGRWTADIVVNAPDSDYSAEDASVLRTPVPLAETPQSVQVLTRQLIDDQDLQNISGALVNVSGVTPTSQAQTVLQAALVRGFSVNYYLDGIPTYQLPAGVGDPATLVNTARIEVAKGPTATLYGGGAGAPLSGLVNLVSLSPDDRFHGRLQLRAGSFDTWGGEADINLPFGDGVGLRVTGMVETADSFIDFISTDRIALFPTFSARIGDSTRLIIRGRYNRLEQTEYAGLPVELTQPSLVIDRDVYAGARDLPRTNVENKAVTATLQHRFSDMLSGEITVNRTISTLEEWGTFPYGQLAGTVYNFGSAYLPSDSKKTFATASLLAQLGNDNFSHALLAGVDFDRTSYFGALFFNPFWSTVDYNAPLPAAPFGPVPGLFFDQYENLKSFAVYVQDQIGMGVAIDSCVGLRWTRLSVTSSVSGLITDDDYSKVTPRIGATVAIGSGLSLFAGYAEGFQGVVAAGFYGLSPVPETSQAWEGGLKINRPQDGLTGTIALYRITRQNVLTPDPSIPFAYVQAGEHRAQGVEVDAIYEPSPAVSLLFNYAFTDAEVTRDNAVPVGDRLRAVPRHSGRLAVRYRLQDGALQGLEIGAGVTAVSRRELTLPNTASVKGNALFDMQFAYPIGPVRLGVNIANLFGADAFEPYQYLGGAYVTPTQPRSVFATLGVRF